MPRATIALIAFNQRQWLAEAIAACFAQTCEPIEILLSDDASSDGSYELMCEMAEAYIGPHAVKCRQNEWNLGIGQHYNRIVEASSGALIVTAAGDDISLPNRVGEILRAWDRFDNKPDLISSHLIDMDFSGAEFDVIRVDNLAKWVSPAHWARKRPYVIGASHAFTKRLHQRFGPFASDLTYEDQVMAFRACCMGGGITVDQPLVKYRRGGVSSQSGKDADRKTFSERTRTKFQRQGALFRQIHADMEAAGLTALWPGKVAQYLYRAELGVALSNIRGRAALIRAALGRHGAGYVWAMRLAVKLAANAYK